MRNILHKILNKSHDTNLENQHKEKVHNTEESTLVTKDITPFAKQYVLADPRTIGTRYDLFSYCKQIPVAYEDQSETGFLPCVSLPNDPTINKYLRLLLAMPDEYRKNPKSRTISIIQLDKDKYIYILPPIKALEGNVIINFENDPKVKGWSLYATPEINKIIISQLKVYTTNTR